MNIPLSPTYSPSKYCCTWISHFCQHIPLSNTQGRAPWPFIAHISSATAGVSLNSHLTTPTYNNPLIPLLHFFLISIFSSWSIFRPARPQSSCPLLAAGSSSSVGKPMLCCPEGGGGLSGVGGLHTGGLTVGSTQHIWVSPYCHIVVQLLWMTIFKITERTYAESDALKKSLWAGRLVSSSGKLASFLISAEQPGNALGRVRVGQKCANQWNMNFHFFASLVAPHYPCDLNKFASLIFWKFTIC